MVGAIRPGQRILIGSGAAEPVRLVEALVKDGAHLRDRAAAVQRRYVPAG